MYLNMISCLLLNIPKSYLYLDVDNLLPQGGEFGWHPYMSSRLGLFRLINEHALIQFKVVLLLEKLDKQFNRFLRILLCDPVSGFF